MSRAPADANIIPKALTLASLQSPRSSLHSYDEVLTVDVYRSHGTQTMRTPMVARLALGPGDDAWSVLATQRG